MTKRLNFTKYLPIIFFGVILITSSLLKILPVLHNNFPFTMDQGRDMLDLRNLIVGHHPALIGPTTSINGVFLGPFWYYFNVIPFLISRGDPAMLVYWNIFWYQLTAVLIFWLSFRHNRYFGLAFSSLFLMTPVFFYSSRFSWNANTMPFIAALFFLSLLTANSKRIWSGLILGVLCGVGMQVEAAFGILFFPFTILWLLLHRTKIKFMALVGAGFILTLLPQVFFELRHNFLMTHNLLNEFSGKTSLLGPKLTWVDTLSQHLKNYSDMPNNVLNINTQITGPLLIISIIFLSWRLAKHHLDDMTKSAFLSGLLFITFSFLVYLFYHYPIKGWYILGLPIPYVLIFAAALTEALRSKNWLATIISVLIITLTFISTTFNQAGVIPTHEADRSSDPSNIRNQIEVVDIVYQKANGQPFKVYNYIPSVYDFPYEYLFWWHGTQKYGYQPDTITYLDNVPEYIPNNHQYWTKQRKVSSTDYPIFLIYQTDSENPDRLNAWMNNFEKLCLQDATIFEYQTTLALKHHCENL